MGYISPFSGIERLDLKYSGSLEAVLTDLENTDDLRVLALHPSRIIRAIVDYKIEHPESNEIELLLKEAIDSTLRIYSTPSKSGEIARALRERLKVYGIEELLQKQLNQDSDYMTTMALEAERSERTAEILARESSEDVLFIALGHGGIAAGMDAYLKFCELSGSRGSRFYVARFSRHKLGDPEPKLSETEIEYLRTIAEGRRIVIFDEDICSGETRKKAINYFSGIFFGKPLRMICNIEQKDFNKKNLQIPIITESISQYPY
jgi:hypothetical protein